MTDYYTGPHQSQLAAGQSAVTHTAGCTWTAGANGIDDTSGGKHRPTPDNLHGYLAKSLETSPGSPGWSLPDLERATYKYAVKYGMPGLMCVNRTNAGFLGAYGWGGMYKAWGAGRYLVIQGDSDRFGNNTCSGKFDGDHCIGVSPKVRKIDGKLQHWIDDGICPGGRWEYDSIIYAYAKKLATRSGTPLRWSAFKGAVPKI